MLKSSTSLWAGDLANLAAEIERVDSYSDLYHIDVADGTYARLLIFFPDLVAAIRKHTAKLLEVHLITRDPQHWIDQFADAGADRIIFYPDACDDPQAVLDKTKARGLSTGISLAIPHPPDVIDPYLDQLDMVCVLGTGFDQVHVPDIAPGTCEKICDLVERRHDRSLAFEIEADGAIRRHTVPQLSRAGADIIVPGSLMLKEDPDEVHRWLATVPGPAKP